MLRQALVHPLALRLSSRQIAGHLHVPESTLRRWRIKLSAPDGADTVRAAVRSGRTYSIETANIGRTRARFISASKQLERLRADFEHMKHLASAEAQVLLSAFGHWIFAQQPATVCLDRIEEVIHRLSPSPLSTPEFVGRPDIT
jgi:transposase-like protein